MKRIPLKYTAEIIAGQSPLSEHCNEDGLGLPFLQGNAEFGERFPRPTIYCVNPTKLAKPGDLLLSVRAPVGALNIANAPCGIGRGLCAVRPRKARLDSRYALYALLERIPDLQSRATGSTFDAVTASDIGALEVSTPLQDQQTAIADFLDRETEEASTLINNYESLLKLLDEKRSALIAQVVTRGLDPSARMKPSGIESIGDIPETWTVERLKHRLRFVTSGSRGWGAYYADSGALFLRISNLTRSEVFLDISDARYVLLPKGTEGVRTLVRDGDVLISITADLGSVAIAQNLPAETYVSQHLALCRPKDPLDSKWLAYALLASPSRAQFQMAAYGGTKIQLSLDDVRNVVIPVPPNPDERNRIVSHIEKNLQEIDGTRLSIEKAIALTKERRAALITAAVTGQIDVTTYKSNLTKEIA